MLAIDLLVFLAAGQLHLRGVDDDHVVARVDERRIGRLVLALQQSRRDVAMRPSTWPSASMTCQRSAGGVRRGGHEVDVISS